MIPILTKHLAEHIIDEPNFACSCGWEAGPGDTWPAHVAETFQAALDAAGATTRTEWGVQYPNGVRVHETRDRAEHDRRMTEEFLDIPQTVVSRTVVSMPWKPAEEVEA